MDPAPSPQDSPDARPKGTVAVLGATGFIGSAIADELLRAGYRVRALVRGELPSDGGLDLVTAPNGILDAAALVSLLQGADYLVNAASYTGKDEAEQHRVNVRGSHLSAMVAAEFGVNRMIYISTCGVYGSAFTAGISEQAEPSPRSALSGSRLLAEESIRANGGLVLRPNFVLGRGDRWVLAAYIRLLKLCGPALAHLTKSTSVINRRGLAQVTTAMLTLDEIEHEVYHVANPKPDSLESLARIITPELLSPVPLAQPGASPVDAARALGVEERQLSLALEDSYVSTARLWSKLPKATVAGPTLLPDDVAWYKDAVSAR